MNLNLLIERRNHDLGGGFLVGRLLPHARRRMVGPFTFFDHMGPLDVKAGADRAIDVRPHPHIGLSTVTYLYSGAITHRDSLGSHQEILPGEVNWMTAGRGITHSERLEAARRRGAVMHGVQAWVALPKEQEDMAPAFFHHQGPDDLPEFHEDGITGRLIAGTIDGVSARTPTYSPLFYLHWKMDAGARRSLGTQYPERAIYVAMGQIEVGGQRVSAGQMAVLDPGHTIQVAARQPSTVMLLGGEPIGERFMFWNFVSSSKARIEQACEDWRTLRMPLPVGDDQEFIPLPERRKG
ncbi:pirin family protein [Castellaniella sp. MT123]|uniref:pirin family protein n=1 Tax=Castellaniella sp. MT123 TaxID=3140381 RepID=UPI0031F3CFB1